MTDTNQRYCSYTLRTTASCLSSLDAVITAETSKIEALKTHKKGLMQQLFPQKTSEAAL